jgi:esterase/lipase superfamily enzyme
MTEWRRRTENGMWVALGVLLSLVFVAFILVSRLGSDVTPDSVDLPSVAPVASDREAQAYKALGEVELSKEHSAQAEAYFGQVLRYDNSDSGARVGVVASHVGQGEIAAAEGELFRLEKEFPGISNTWGTDTLAKSSPSFVYYSLSTAVAKTVTVVPVFYATDRAPTGIKEANVFYGGSRANALTYGVSSVSIPYRHRRGRIERPPAIPVLGVELRGESSAKDIVAVDVKVLKRDDFLSLVAESSKGTNSSIFVFVHGYNVEWAEALRRTAQLAYDIGLSATTPILYSWPSQGSPAQYIADRDAATWTVAHFRDFLKTLAADARVTRINVIAHSMGNQVAVRALPEVFTAAAERKLGQVVLTAPDIGAEEFRTELGPRLRGIAARLTLYASSADEILSLSRFANNVRRAGDSDDLVIVDGIDTIDASAVSTGFGHSVFAEVRTVVEDLGLIIREGLPPDRRNLLKRTRGAATYWAFAP